MAEKNLTDTSTNTIIEDDDPNYKKALQTGKVKIDFLVAGVCMVLYLLSFLDKANLGNAKVAGLMDDLELSSYQYSLALTLLYIPYILVELPANLILKRVGAHILLPSLTFAFGLVCCLQGLVHNYAGLVACRIVLGAAEGGLVPAIVLYLSTFYPPHQFQLRSAFLFAFAALAGAFSGLLAAAIQLMDGLGNKPGWAWIFIVEGAVTCVFAVAAYFVMTPSIEKAWWLKDDEKAALRKNFNTSGRDKEEHAPFTWAEVWSGFTSPVVLLSIPIFLANGLILFGLAYFQPTIVASFGYSKTQTQLRSVPPYAVTFVVALTASYYSDKYGQRAIYIASMGGLAVIGYAISLATLDSNARYAGLFFSTFGGYGASPALSAWVVDNVAPHYKRGTAIALCFIGTQIGGIISTWIYPEEEAPKYVVGGIVSVVGASILVLAPLCLAALFIRENKKRAEKLKSTHDFDDSGPMSDADIRFKYSI